MVGGDSRKVYRELGRFLEGDLALDLTRKGDGDSNLFASSDNFLRSIK